MRARFGEPERIWDEPGGARTLEYNRQPAGHQNYMITIGPDGRMSALRQVLAPTCSRPSFPACSWRRCAAASASRRK